LSCSSGAMNNLPPMASVNMWWLNKQESAQDHVGTRLPRNLLDVHGLGSPLVIGAPSTLSAQLPARSRLPGCSD
jgi:hypothetical protein